jgi:hypothetical protein
MKKQILSVVFAIATILVVTTSYASDKTSVKANEGYVVRSVIDGRQARSAYKKKGSGFIPFSSTAWITLIKTL